MGLRGNKRAGVLRASGKGGGKGSIRAGLGGQKMAHGNRSGRAGIGRVRQIGGYGGNQAARINDVGGRQKQGPRCKRPLGQRQSGYGAHGIRGRHRQSCGARNR